MAIRERTNVNSKREETLSLCVGSFPGKYLTADGL